jgi:hypothetical protein
MAVVEPSRVPADRGLVCLGLLAQLAGSVFAAYGTLTAFAALFAALGGDDSLWVFMVLGTGVGRSLVHRAAGTQLVYGRRAIGVPGPVEPVPSDEQRLAGVARYIAAAIVHTMFVAAIASEHFHTRPCGVLAIIAASLVWPTVLGVATTRPSIRALGRKLPIVEDKGFEALAIVMTVLACIGLAIGLTLLGYMLQQPAEMLQQGPWLIAIVMVGTLVVRSALHLRAGIAGLRETSIERAVAFATRYANFGVISTFCGGAVLLLFVTAQFDLVGFAVLMGGAWMLLAWPLIVRRFVRDRHFDDLLADEHSAHHRAPDTGLTGLGWLLAGNAAFALTWLLLRVATDGRPPLAGALAVLGAPTEAIEWQLFVIALGGWAAAELVCMTSRARGAALAWALASAGIAIYLLGPELDMSYRGIDFVSGTTWLGSQIVLAAATMLLVTRRVAPTARARYRVRP